MGSFFSSLLGGSGGEGSPESSHVQAFHSSARWQLHLNSLKESPKLMVIDFAATWCGPCRTIEPHIHGLADKYADVSFAKIDVDELPEFKVQAMPTFVLMKGGKEVDRVIGAKKDELEKKIVKYRATS
ncbi:thioredoxin H2 isoform X2 [Punica granatum]|uniref:Thioredoxin H2 isoform X2 n=1 Tax=Punica granatum TaxID=22663 RepID=A0A6P8CIV2_PUNGR|nr:thioredoxin H2 isoform X2 [Punica granatum]